MDQRGINSIPSAEGQKFPIGSPENFSGPDVNTSEKSEKERELAAKMEDVQRLAAEIAQDTAHADAVASTQHIQARTQNAEAPLSEEGKKLKLQEIINGDTEINGSDQAKDIMDNLMA